MADINAPFITASEINSQPGDAALSGVQANFDPSNKQPLQNLQDTFTRLDTEDFQRKQQEDRQRHDILTRLMENEHSDKVLKYNQAMKDRQDMFNFFNQTGHTAATLKDDQGNDMSIGFMPQDQEKLNQETNDFQKTVMSNPTGYKYDPEFTKTANELKQKRINASLRSVYYKQAQQQLQNTFDPTEKQRISDYMGELQAQPLTEKDVPHPFVGLPTIKPLIDVQKDYPQGKGLVSYPGGEGVPGGRFDELKTTNNPELINEGFKRYQLFKNQPEGQSAEDYNSFQNTLNGILKDRGEKPFDLGGSVTNDGKVIFDDNTPLKQQKLARNMLYASEMMKSGRLQPADEAEVLKQKKIKAEIAAENAATSKNIVETAIKQQEREFGKTKPLTPEQQQIFESSKNTVRRAWEIYNPAKYEGKEGTPMLPETKVTKKHWFTKDETEEGYKPIGGIDVGAALKAEGLNPTDYKVFQAPAGVEEGVGKQRVGIGMNAHNGPTGKEFKTGEDEKVDKAFTLYNPTTKEVKIAFFKNVPKKQDGETKVQSQLLNIVSGRDYVTHAPNGKYQWGIHGGKQVNNLSFETEQNQNLWDAIQEQAPHIAVPVASQKATTKTKVLNGVTYEQVDGKWFKVQ